MSVAPERKCGAWQQALPGIGPGARNWDTFVFTAAGLKKKVKEHLPLTAFFTSIPIRASVKEWLENQEPGLLLLTGCCSSLVYMIRSSWTCQECWFSFCSFHPLIHLLSVNKLKVEELQEWLFQYNCMGIRRCATYYSPFYIFSWKSWTWKRAHGREQEFEHLE